MKTNLTKDKKPKPTSERKPNFNKIISDKILKK